MPNTKTYHVTPMCRPDGSIDIAVRASDDKIICRTLGQIDDNVIAAISQAYRTAELIAAALNAYQGRKA